MREIRVAVAVAMCLAVVACNSPAASPSSSPAGETPPTGRPSPSPAAPTPSGTPAPSDDPGISAWPFQTGEIRGIAFGRDGAVYFSTWTGEAPSELVALDRNGTVKPGWPVDLGMSHLAAGPFEAEDGTVIVLAFEPTGDDQGAYALHRFAAGGQSVDGWPYLFSTRGSCHDTQLLPDGLVVLPCGSEQGSSLTAVDPAGDVAWATSTELPNAIELSVAPDGTFYLHSTFGDPGIAAFAGDGTPLPGWPMSLPGLGGAEALADSSVLAWTHDPVQEICNEGSGTTYVAFDRTGQVLPGWPQVLEGYTSNPTIGPDGTVYIVTKQNRAFAFAPDGSLRDGWPASVAGNTGSCFGPNKPVLGADGTLFIATGGQAPEGALTALNPDGTLVDGWPFIPSGELAYPCRIGCTPGPAEPFAPLLDGDRAYVATYTDGPDGGGGVHVFALDRTGAVVDGSMVHLPDPEAFLHLAPDGRLFAFVVPVEGMGTSSITLLEAP